MTKHSWKDRYATLLNEELTIDQIAIVLNKGKTSARLFRKEILDDLAKEDIQLPNQQIPVELVMKKYEEKYKKDFSYFEKMYQREKRLTG